MLDLIYCATLPPTGVSLNLSFPLFEIIMLLCLPFPSPLLSPARPSMQLLPLETHQEHCPNCSLQHVQHRQNCLGSQNFALYKKMSTALHSIFGT
uniref:Uncharacterized protein n=1 Tax=Arundo donax TaxID=35708 RepID=A0A0A8YJ31_ARUDO